MRKRDLRPSDSSIARAASLWSTFAALATVGIVVAASACSGPAPPLATDEPPVTSKKKRTREIPAEGEPEPSADDRDAPTSPQEGTRPADPTCTKDADCNSPRLICEANKCVGGTRTGGTDAGTTNGCAKDADCALNSICNSGSCVSGCRNSYDCKLASICTSGKCVDGCATNNDCPLGNVCGSTKKCIAGCQTNADCPNGSSCGATNKCISSCTASSQCQLNNICSGGKCIEGCVTNNDCKIGSVCNYAGKCVTGCASSNDCPLGKICSASTCISGCNTSSDCPTDEVCVGGQCTF